MHEGFSFARFSFRSMTASNRVTVRDVEQYVCSGGHRYNYALSALSTTNIVGEIESVLAYLSRPGLWSPRNLYRETTPDIDHSFEGSVSNSVLL